MWQASSGCALHIRENATIAAISECSHSMISITFWMSEGPSNTTTRPYSKNNKKIQMPFHTTHRRKWIRYEGYVVLVVDSSLKANGTQWVSCLTSNSKSFRIPNSFTPINASHEPFIRKDIMKIYCLLQKISAKQEWNSSEAGHTLTITHLDAGKVGYRYGFSW